MMQMLDDGIHIVFQGSERTMRHQHATIPYTTWYAPICVLPVTPVTTLPDAEAGGCVREASDAAIPVFQSPPCKSWHHRQLLPGEHHVASSGFSAFPGRTHFGARKTAMAHALLANRARHGEKARRT